MNLHFQKGLTIIELMVAIGILTILFALSTINLSRLPSTTAQSSSYDLLISDLRSQQTKAMAGSMAESFGIHFESTSYTLFEGEVYSESDPGNFVVTLDPNLSFTASSFAADSSGSFVVFSSGSGDLASSGSITITNSFTGDVRTVNLNKYGATEE